MEFSYNPRTGSTSQNTSSISNFRKRTPAIPASSVAGVGKKRIRPSKISDGGAIYFSGTSQSHLVYSQNALWEFGTEDFTIECFYKQQQGGSAARLFGVDNWPDVPIGISLENSTGYLWVNGINYAFARPALNVWHHIAVVRESGVFLVYVDGQLVLTKADLTSEVLGGEALGIGNEPTTNTNSTYKGYITNFRISFGDYQYTGGSFEVPVNILEKEDSTSLLLLSKDTNTLLKDTSDNNLVPSSSSGLSWNWYNS